MREDQQVLKEPQDLLDQKDQRELKEVEEYKVHKVHKGHKVQLDPQGSLSWTGQNPQPPHEAQTFSADPGTSWWQRFMVRVLSWLPIEGLL